MSIEGQPGRKAFRRYATLVLAYLLFVIVFGAWVRITGSGAGCGEHWPSCHGEILPRTPSQQTLIEYTHRVTSGLLGLLVMALPLWAWRVFPRGHAARRASLYTLLLVAVEAGIGAGLVKQGLVANDASLARAVVVALHLVNTLLLTASATLSVVLAAEPPPPSLARASRVLLYGMGALLVALCLVAASGAVTALGDTLFPVGSVSSASSEHFLVQLRVVHPLLACAAAGGALVVAGSAASAPGARFSAGALGALSVLQLLLGGVNVLLRAPGWLQLVHLLAAQLLWISAVALARKLWGAAPREV